jgi:hypothetical protein
MAKIIRDTSPKGDEIAEGVMAPVSRKMFFKYAGATLAAGIALSSCKDDDDDEKIIDPKVSVDLGTGDTGILNYAYLLEQLEAAFYIQVLASPYSGMTTDETTILQEIRDHEKVHRDFFKAALSSSAIAQVEFDFSTIDFNSRASVLGAAKTFEDLGVSAYNGAGKLIADANYLLLAGKIVSVEARHASAIRDLLNPFSADFSGDDVVSADDGLDLAKTPTEVLTAAGKYVKATVKFDKLPS